MTTQYTFDGPRRTAERRGQCPTCHRPVVRRKTFEHTVSPFNKRPDGTPKTWSEVAADVRAEAEAWNPGPEVFEHQRCYDARHAPQPAGYEPVPEQDLARVARERELVLRWLEWTESTGLPVDPTPMSWHVDRDVTKASVHLHPRHRMVVALADVLSVTEVQISRSEGDLDVRFTGRIPDESIRVTVTSSIDPHRVERPRGDTMTVDALAAWIEITGQTQYSRRNR